MEGAQVPVTVPLSAPCPTCHGTGAKPGTSPTICTRCQGRGVEAESQGLFSISQPCRQCGGTGTEIKDPCPTCHGSGRTRQVKRYRVNIPAGVRDGSRVRLAGKGEAGPRGGPAGDLYVITRVGDSPIFTRKGDNLEVEVPITIPEAIRGATIEVPDAQRHQAHPRSPGHPARHGPAPARRGPAASSAAAAAATSTTGSRSTCPSTLSREQSEAVDELAAVMDGNPRERLLRRGSERRDGRATTARAAST